MNNGGWDDDFEDVDIPKMNIFLTVFLSFFYVTLFCLIAWFVVSIATF